MNEKKIRVEILCRKYVPVLIAGMIYALWIRLTGLYIPCPFRALTGYLCPGCGISHCLIALLSGNINKAYQENGFVLILLPFALLYALYRSCRYIKYGKADYSKTENSILIMIIIAAVLFAVMRNIQPA